MAQDIFILGATGNVGSTLVSQIFNSGDTDSKMHANPTRIVGLASLMGKELVPGYIYSAEGLTKEQCDLFLSGKYKRFEALVDLLKEIKNSVVFVDVTPDKNVIGFHKKIIEETDHAIVTANKNPISLCDYDTFQMLTEDPTRYGYRCSVMAGAESISFLQDLRDVNDKPTLIQGCFSGTLGYLTSELEKGRAFSDIIKEAKEEGYTEPHPRDDLNGLDVARKLLILTRTAGYNVEMKDIKISPFIPEKYFVEEDVQKFLESTAELNFYFKDKIEKAEKAGNTLRYVAQMENGKLTVGLKEVSKQSPLGSLNGTLNKISIVSSAYPVNTPYSVEAPGAGLEVTAQNIRRDLLYRLKNRRFLI